MSKSKRFEFYSDEDLIGVLDTVTGRTFNSFEIVDLLNEQQAIIEHLTVEKFKENKRFTKLLSEQQATINELQNDIIRKDEVIKILKEERQRLIYHLNKEPKR